MSTTPPPPPDRPTERLQPSPPPREVYEERVAPAAVDRDVVLLRLEDAIGSLRTGLMIVGVLAVAALGVAIYALVEEDDNGGGSRGGLATDDRVSQLDDRIDRISRQVQDLRSGEDGGDDVEGRVAALERTVETLADRPANDPQEAIDELSGRIDDLAQDVEALKGAQPAP
ncbi:MAG TPA: hypothetical protein VGV67_11505 [Solirubrobacteraceae bacterium]|nr:hypothetical protein [Solirubrobacteraceae bacterium]